MIVLITHHYVNPEKLEAGRQRVQTQGQKMSTYPGFISRINAEDVDDPTHIVAVSYWESSEALNGWQAGPDRRQDRTEWTRPAYLATCRIVEEFTPGKAT